MENLTKEFVDLAFKYGPSVVLALVVLLVGLPIVKILQKVADRALSRDRFDATGRNFILGVLGILLKFTLLLIVAQTLGIKTTSLVAILGAAGLAIGLSLKDSLSNFAAGFFMVYFKPFRVGDFVEVQGQAGTVKEIQIFSTILTTPDNRRIIIPNGAVISGTIINYSAENKRRVDFTFGIAYEDSIPKAKEVLWELIKADKRIDADPEPTVAIQALADSSVNFVVRVWANKEDYWNIFFDMQEKVKLTFDERGISIPYPQRTVWQAAAVKGAEA